MNNTINNRVPGIPRIYQEVAREATLEFEQKMRERQSSIITTTGIPKKYLGTSDRGATACVQIYDENTVLKGTFQHANKFSYPGRNYARN